MTTNSYKEIGGYFNLEIEQKFNNISDSIAFNCARNCLRYIIRAYNIKELFVPYYTCPVVWQAIQKENCQIKPYHIDDMFMPETDFDKNSFILYTNYFGICAKNVKELAEKYRNLIVDNAQSFYMPKYGIASFNSIRKFFGVPDGAILYSDKILDENFEYDTTYDRCSHLLKRSDVNAELGYKDFQKNEEYFNLEPIKKMSNLAKNIFNSIDLDKAKQKRLNNFKILHSCLKQSNELEIKLDIEDVPMVYPYLIKDADLRKKLIENKIFVAKYWESMPESYKENLFWNYLIPLPVDQRYSEKDMQYIAEVIFK